MKIATFNINNVNKRLANLLDWLERQAGRGLPSGAKGDGSEFPVAAIEKAGYGAVWRGQKSWNGVAILARGCEPVVTRTALPGDPADTQSRYIEAAVNGVLIGSLYAPNGNPQPGPKFKYKLAWMEAADRARRRALRPRCAGRAGGRLQRRADRRGHLPDQILQGQCARAARAARACSRAFSIRAGSMRSARCIPTRRCTRSGITCGTVGRAMPACGSIICC